MLCLSDYILEETTAALLREKNRARYGFLPDKVARFHRDLQAIARMVDDLPDIRAVPLDPKDDKIVATAVKAGAGYLVTGDRTHLLALGEYEGIKIITPRAFLDLL